MASKKREGRGITRREFLQIAGTVGATTTIGAHLDLIERRVSGLFAADNAFARGTGEETVVALVKDSTLPDDDDSAYRMNNPPFDPPEIYPEYPYSSTNIDSDNKVYPMVREAFRLLNPEGFGTSNWNPLGNLIDSSHNKVLVKPNLVQAHYRDVCQGAVIRAVLDYVFIALQKAGGGKIRVGDAPDGDDPLSRVAAVSRLDVVVSTLVSRGVPIDGSRVWDINNDSTFHIGLGSNSEYSSGSVSPPPAGCKWITHRRDSWDGKYDVAESFFWPEVIINMPKFKTHCSSGVSLAMKNLMGCLTPGEHFYKDVPHNRNNPDDNKTDPPYNDSVWRGIVDITKMALYYKGGLKGSRQRRFFVVGDGVVGTQGAGPHGTWGAYPAPSKCIVAGYEPVAVDAVICRVMGVKWDKLQTTNYGSQVSHYLGPAHPKWIELRLPEDMKLSEEYPWGYLDSSRAGYDLYWGHSQEISGLTDCNSPSLRISLDEEVVTAEVVDSNNEIARVELFCRIGTEVHRTMMSLVSGGGNSGTYKASLLSGANEYRVMAMDRYFNDAWTDWQPTGVQPLQAHIRADVKEGTAPLTVRFEGWATGGAPPYFYFWSFGDGHTSNEQNPIHTYLNQTGEDILRTVTLTVVLK